MQQQQQVDLTDQQPIELKLPAEWGSYRLEVELLDQPSKTRTSKQVWAGYRGQDDGSLKPDRISLSLDKAAYQAGEIAQLTLQAPHAGQGYLLVESAAGVLWQQPIKLANQPQTIKLPIAEDWNSHDLYISALVVRPGAKKTDTTPKRAVGLLHLPLDRQAKRLAVEVSAPEQARPLQPLVTKIKVKQADGAAAANAKVLVSAVDVGVLSITDFATPDPFEGFYGRKKYALDQYDVYHQLIDASQGKLAKLKFGGDAADAPSTALRALAKPVIVAEQSQVITLNSDGEAEVSLAMPDFNGQLRVMVQAWSDDQFASAEQNVQIFAPVVAELAMPRFIGSGDQLQAQLELTNLTEQPQQLNLQATTQGLIELIEALPSTTQLAPKQRQLLPVMLRGQLN